MLDFLFSTTNWVTLTFYRSTLRERRNVLSRRNARLENCIPMTFVDFKGGGSNHGTESNLEFLSIFFFVSSQMIKL